VSIEIQKYATEGAKSSSILLQYGRSNGEGSRYEKVFYTPFREGEKVYFNNIIQYGKR
jgi:hypothetical protein